MVVGWGKNKQWLSSYPALYLDSGLVFKAKNYKTIFQLFVLKYDD